MAGKKIRLGIVRCDTHEGTQGHCHRLNPKEYKILSLLSSLFRSVSIFGYNFFVKRCISFNNSPAPDKQLSGNSTGGFLFAGFFTDFSKYFSNKRTCSNSNPGTLLEDPSKVSRPLFIHLPVSAGGAALKDSGSEARETGDSFGIREPGEVTNFSNHCISRYFTNARSCLKKFKQRCISIVCNRVKNSFFNISNDSFQRNNLIGKLSKLKFMHFRDFIFKPFRPANSI